VTGRPNYSQADDADLLAHTASDPEAFSVFYERFEAQVLGFFWRATHRADIAADLTAEVFAAALESAAAFRAESGSARGWLFGIARHELADTWERGRIEDRARRRMRVAPQMLGDEALERVEEVASRAPPWLLRADSSPSERPPCLCRCSPVRERASARSRREPCAWYRSLCPIRTAGSRGECGR
jgi:DNA-directed RNA polymerase specialized sigma24 family protein